MVPAGGKSSGKACLWLPALGSPNTPLPSHPTPTWLSPVCTSARCAWRSLTGDSLRVTDPLPVLLCLSALLDSALGPSPGAGTGVADDHDRVAPMLASLRILGRGAGARARPSLAPEAGVDKGALADAVDDAAAAAAAAGSRGVPGEPLLPGDAAAVRLAPLRQFEAGEVVAWPRDTGHGPVDGGTRSTLVYGWCVARVNFRAALFLRPSCPSPVTLTPLLPPNPLPTFHPSPLTPHPSPLTPHPSPLTPHPSPLTPLLLPNSLPIFHPVSLFGCFVFAL